MNTATKVSKQDTLIFKLSLVVSAYFLFLIVSYQLHYRPVLLGVIMEMFTIPFALLLLVLFVLSIINFIKSRFKLSTVSFTSLLILSITLVIMIFTL